MRIETLFDQFFDVSENDFIKVVKSYFSNSENLDQLSSSGASLLHLAVENGYLELTHWLVMNGADIESKNSQGWTPLMLAVDSEIDDSLQNSTDLNFETVKLLIELGADTNAGSLNGKSIFDIAEGYSKSALLKLNEITV